MRPIQHRVFSRLVDSPTSLTTAVTAVTNEVNDFLLTIDPINVSDVRCTARALGKYGERVFYKVIVFYVVPA